MAIAVERPDGADIGRLSRKPGEFARSKQGAPWVAHPTETTKHSGKKADLIVLCAERGIPVPERVTVAQLHELLGGRPKKVMYGRPSSLGKQIENQTNLQKWSERAVALGLWMAYDQASETGDMPDLDADICKLAPEQRNLDDDEAKDILDAIAVKAKNRAQAGIAAERGTHGHELTEDHDNEVDWIARVTRGEDLGLPESVQYALVAAWAKMLGQFDIEILATEAQCVDDVWRQAGTLDRIVRLRKELTFTTTTAQRVTLPAGWVGILDIKTGKLRLGLDGLVDHWLGYSVQLASYAQSVRYDPDTDVRSPWEWEIDQQYAVIAHLDILSALAGEAKCRLVLVDLEAGRYAGALCVTAREWERRRDVFSIPTDELTVSVPVNLASDSPSEEPAAVPAVQAPPAEDAPSSAGGDLAPVVPPTPDVPQPPVELPTTQDDDEAGELDPTARRAELLARYAALGRDDKLRFTDLRDERGVDMADLDAVAAVLDAIADSAGIATKSVRRVVITRALIDAAKAARAEWGGPLFAGDEGQAVDDATRDAMRTAITTLPSAATDLFNSFAAQAHRTVGSFSMASGATRRRWEIARALVSLARSFWDDEHGEFGWDDELVRGALVTVTGDEAIHQPDIGLGIVLGMLELDQAIAFADLAASIERGGVLPDSSTGRWLWQPAPAA